MGTNAYCIVIPGVKVNQILLFRNVDVMLLLRCCLFSSVCFKYHFMRSGIFVCALSR
jgi:hypothetical protein